MPLEARTAGYCFEGSTGVLSVSSQPTAILRPAGRQPFQSLARVHAYCGEIAPLASFSEALKVGKAAVLFRCGCTGQSRPTLRKAF